MKLQRINNEYITYTPISSFLLGTLTLIPRKWDKLENAIAYISLWKK